MALLRIAVIGEGVVGLSSATALLQTKPTAKITIFHDRLFEQTCSFGPAGLFRIDSEKHRDYGRASFAWFAKLHREYNGEETGVKLVSGHIQSDSKELLETQERIYGDVVYNFRWLTEDEKNSLFIEPSKYCIHYTAFATEGRKYVPFLKKQLLMKGAVFQERVLENINELGDEGYDIIINCAGLNGGKLAGDDDTVYPSRGIVFEVDAPWQKHFNYRDFETFSIPRLNTLAVGSVKQINRSDTEITEEDRRDIWHRYEKLHPAIRGSKVIGEWCGIRPMRDVIRVEKVKRINKEGKEYTIVHHYGHGSNGITLGWGSAERVVSLIENVLFNKQDEV